MFDLSQSMVVPVRKMLYFRQIWEVGPKQAAMKCKINEFISKKRTAKWASKAVFSLTAKIFCAVWRIWDSFGFSIPFIVSSGARFITASPSLNNRCLDFWQVSLSSVTQSYLCPLWSIPAVLGPNVCTLQANRDLLVERPTAGHADRHKQPETSSRKKLHPNRSPQFIYHLLLATNGSSYQ